MCSGGPKYTPPPPPAPPPEPPRLGNKSDITVSKDGTATKRKTSRRDLVIDLVPESGGASGGLVI